MRSFWPIVVAAIVLAAFAYVLTQFEDCEVGKGCSLSIGGFKLGK
jgi:hypothetical protein